MYAFAGARLLHVENVIHHHLVRHSVAALRVAVGAIFLGFGVLKYFPGVSPAESLTKATTHIPFLGLVPGGVAIVIVATMECFIGLCLLSNRGMRAAVWVLAGEFIGILSPLVLLPGRLFAGPHHAPTLEGQYVLKDLILVAAGGGLKRVDGRPAIERIAGGFERLGEVRRLHVGVEILLRAPALDRDERRGSAADRNSS